MPKADHHRTKAERARHRNKPKRKRTKRQPLAEFREYKPKPVWRPDQPDIPSLDEIPAGAVGTQTIMDKLHKEAPEVQAEILAKATRLAPLYNKGAYQYIPEDDVKNIGRK